MDTEAGLRITMNNILRDFMVDKLFTIFRASVLIYHVYFDKIRFATRTEESYFGNNPMNRDRAKMNDTHFDP